MYNSALSFVILVIFILSIPILSNYNYYQCFQNVTIDINTQFRTWDILLFRCLFNS